LKRPGDRGGAPPTGPGAGRRELQATKTDGEPRGGKLVTAGTGSWVGVAAARRAAFEVLLEVGSGRGHSDDLLHSSRLSGLSGQDRNLATALVMGTLRWQIALDARLRGLLARPDQRMADEVWVALRMGAFQLLHMDRIPAHAALSESVAMCRGAGQEHAAGMVNAVLRRLTREPAAGVKLYESTTGFAERLGHPAWMVERWVQTYGRAVAMAICEGGQREPGRSSMFAEGAEAPADGAELGGEDDAANAELSGALGTKGMPIIDDGSRLVAEIAAAAMRAVKGRAAQAWDCCAAPGGKTIVLALRLGAADILATDVSGRRMRAMEQRLGALAASAGDGGRVRCVTADAETLPAEEGAFDLVLCDVPCTGTGTLARNPEIRHRLQREDLSRMAQRQRTILAAAMGRVAEGGRLLYSTCSLEGEECEAVVAAVASGWRFFPVGELMESLQAKGVLRTDLEWGSMVRGEHLRTLPGMHECDGFYAVVLERS